jgi:hypothetical protein
LIRYQKRNNSINYNKKAIIEAIAGTTTTTRRAITGKTATANDLILNLE